MRTVMRTMLVVANVLFLAAGAAAQSAVDPAGHWEGAVVTPNGELPIEIDLGRIDGQALVGALSVPSQQLAGMPLGNVRLEGPTLTFAVLGSGGGTFRGTVSGTSIEGEFSTAQGTTTFHVKRTGAARLATPPKGPALPKDMEGTWMGTLQAGGRTMRIQLTMSNGADGKSTAKATSLDEGGLELPVAITDASPSTFTFNVPATGASYTGVVNAARTEIAGTYAQRGTLPLTFTRVAP